MAQLYDTKQSALLEKKLQPILKR